MSTDHAVGVGEQVGGNGQKRTRCLVCTAEEVETFLDLGSTSLANKFLSRDELSRPERRYPLRTGFCHRCGHVQLMESVPPSDLFEDYLYVSSASDTLRTHFEELSATLVERHQLTRDDLVVDIGCNDCSLLDAFRRRGVRTLGVDPARNLADLVRELSIDRYVGFFGAATAEEIVSRWGKASLVTATNTFPHIPELHDFVKGMETLLAPGGVFVIEAHYLVDLLDQMAFDTIYHEHVSYWALQPMTDLFRQFDMAVVRAERLPIHHGQLRVTVQRRGEAVVDPSVTSILSMERDRGLGTFRTFQAFADQVRRIRHDLQTVLSDLKRRGHRLAGYGAPAKGSTLLEYLNIGPQLLDYIVDKSALKQGRYTPGSRIPIVAPEQLLVDRPDYTLLLAWNFAEEILKQQAAYRARGGKFIIPVPRVQIV